MWPFRKKERKNPLHIDNWDTEALESWVQDFEESLLNDKSHLPSADYNRHRKHAKKVRKEIIRRKKEEA